MSDATPESFLTAAAEPQTARGLRRFARWTVVFVVLAVVLVPAAVAPFVIAAHQSRRLLRTGTRVPGEVTDTWMGAKGIHYMEVAYRVDGAEYAQAVEISSSRSYGPGDHVTVVADPTNFLHMRTVAEPNESPGLTLIGIGFTSIEAIALIVAVNMIPRYLSMRRRCETNRWVPARAGPQRTWRRLCGVTLEGAGPDVVVNEKLRTFLEGPAWVLADTRAGRSAVVRVHKRGPNGGPVQLAAFSTWKAKRLDQSHQSA